MPAVMPPNPHAQVFMIWWLGLSQIGNPQHMDVHVSVVFWGSETLFPITTAFATPCDGAMNTCKPRLPSQWHAAWLRGSQGHAASNSVRYNMMNVFSVLCMRLEL